jgi:hypothetical protein
MMIAMQYSFTLPGDYDMSIIERRVQEKGRGLDNHRPLIFKAYLIARKDDPVTRGHENLYAPFYLWQGNEGLGDFICSAGFAGLVNSFGWPAVRTWPAIIATEQKENIRDAAFATREIRPIAPFTSLDTLRTDERRLTGTAVNEDGALLALSAFEPTTWTLVRFRLWSDSRQTARLTEAQAQAYNVLHVSNPARK